MICLYRLRLFIPDNQFIFRKLSDLKIKPYLCPAIEFIQISIFFFFSPERISL